MDLSKKLIKIMIFSALFVVMGFVSCGKKSDNTSTENGIGDAEIITVSDNDLSESDEDLLTVDYKEFYDELAPHGEWIEVTDKDIDVKMKKGSATGNAGGHRKISLSDFFGVKDAYAYDDMSFGAFFVWRPSPNLAVGLSVTEPEPTYVPYSNGQWLYTDAGWYFRAATPYEETVHHYGRWVYSPALGWIWVPGRVRSPAWVDWREDDSYIAWAPVPPSVYIVNNVVIVPPIYEERYIVVERRHFCEPYIYKHHHKGNKYRITEWHRPDGIVVVDNMVQNHGPDIVRIQNTIGRNISPVSIHSVKDVRDVKYSEKEISVYSPDFKKVKTEKKFNSSFTKPGKYDSYRQYSGKNNEQGDNKGNDKSDSRGSGNENRSNDKSGKDNNSKNYDKGNKDNGSKNYNDNKSKGKQRIGDDSNMKDGGKNREKNNDKGRNKNDNNVKQKSEDNNNKGGKDKQKGNKKFRNDYKSKDNQKNYNRDNSGKSRNDNSKKRSDGNLKQKGNNKQQRYDSRNGSDKQSSENKQKSSNRQKSSEKQKGKNK